MPDDTINSPQHYNTGRIEVIEMIEDQDLGFHLGNALKYICRAGKKNPHTIVEDLKKSIWYVNRKIELLEADLQEREALRPNEMPQKRKK